MKGNELVWRTLVDSSFEGSRAWANADDLAHRAGVPASTALFALKRLVAIGAVERRPRGGFLTTNPEKVLLVLAAWRNLDHDMIARTTREAGLRFLETEKLSPIIGGPEAAVAYIDSRGMNTVSDLGTRVVYITHPDRVPALPAGDELIILALDKSAERDWWQGRTSRAQTYADLFALPGWQAEEFRRALHRVLFTGADWDQQGERWADA